MRSICQTTQFRQHVTCCGRVHNKGWYHKQLNQSVRGKSPTPYKLSPRVLTLVKCKRRRRAPSPRPKTSWPCSAGSTGRHVTNPSLIGGGVVDTDGPLAREHAEAWLRQKDKLGLQLSAWSFTTRGPVLRLSPLPPKCAK